MKYLWSSSQRLAAASFLASVGMFRKDLDFYWMVGMVVHAPAAELNKFEFSHYLRENQLETFVEILENHGAIEIIVEAL